MRRTMNKLKVALIGAGRIAQRHAKHVHALGELVAVCDIDLAKAEALGVVYNVAAYSSHTEMLNAIEADVITICTPNGLHAKHAIDALNNGFHVLCEKPMGISAAECQEMIDVAATNDRKLFAIMQNRFNPPVAAVKQVIDEGRLGNILSVHLSCFWNRNEDYYRDSWKGTKALDGGCLYTQFSHFVDLLYWMFGSVDQVAGFSKNSQHQGVIEFEDNGVVALQFSNGALGSIHFTVNSHAQNMEGSLTVFGTKGTVKIGGQYLNELEYQNIEGYEITNLPSGNTANNYGQYQGSMSNHDEVYKNLIDVMQNGGAIATSALEGMQTVALIDQIYAALHFD